MSNALVPIAPTDRDRANVRPGIRANADFVAQLIATSGHAPQTRARRRAEPEQAIAAYRALGQWPTLPGRELCRSL